MWSFLSSFVKPAFSGNWSDVSHTKKTQFFVNKYYVNNYIEFIIFFPVLENSDQINGRVWKD